MHFAQSLLTLALVAASAVTAAPAQAQAEEPHTLTIPLSKRASLHVEGTNIIDYAKVNQRMQRLRAKYGRTLGAYQRNTGKLHPLDVRVSLPQNENEKRATGTVPLTDHSETLWTGPVTVGSSRLDVDFDTGSSDFVADHSAYTPGSTSRNTGNSFQVAYGDGTTASGPIYTDNASLGGLSADNVYIGRAADDNFIGNGANALAGMGFPQLSTFPAKTPIYKSLQDQGKLSQYAFYFNLKTSGSSLVLGTVASGSTYVSVSDSRGYWQVPAKLNGASINSIVDSGTTLVVAPTSVANNLFNQLGIQSFTQDGVLYGYYDCSQTPRVTFTYGSKTITLTQAASTFGQTNQGDCVLSVIGQNLGINAVITGDPVFVSSKAVSFDVANSRVGFA